jgi:undecaprenyl-diphosphatase
MHNVIHAALLGLVQGATEILPISSSAHLILVPRLLGWPESGLAFDAALHLGTLVALLIYFRRDVVTILSDTASSLRHCTLATPGERLPYLIVIGSLPAVLAGFFFEKQIEGAFRSAPLLIALFLIIFALILAIADRYGRKERDLASMTLPAVLIIGIAQALALAPGVSRSGVTITAALFIGFSRPAAARFSFLLSLPIVLGAGGLKSIELLRQGLAPGDLPVLITGILSAAVVGYASIAFLLRFVERHSILPFVWYRLILGTLLLVFLFPF